MSHVEAAMAAPAPPSRPGRLPFRGARPRCGDSRGAARRRELLETLVAESSKPSYDAEGIELF